MQLLCELLDLPLNLLMESISDEELMLFEHLGTLNVINKKFIKLMKTKRGWGDSKAPTSLVDGLGEHSEIDVQKETHQNQMWNRLSKSDAVALVVKYGDKQVLAIVKGEDYKRNKLYTIVAEDDLFKTVFKSEKEYVDEMGDMGQTYSTKDFRVDRLKGSMSTSGTGKIKKLLKLVLDKAKADKVDVSSMTIMTDKERLKKSGERAERRRDTEPPKGGRHNRVGVGAGQYRGIDELARTWEKHFRSDLRDRLERYKANKADEVADQAAMLKKIITDGYLDKINVGGITYKLTNERLYMRELKAREKGEPERGLYSEIPYIEYEFDNSGKAADKFQQELTDLRKSMSSEEYYKKREEILPPRRLRVLLKLQGGSIVPYKIEPGKDKASLW